LKTILPDIYQDLTVEEIENDIAIHEHVIKFQEEYLWKLRVVLKRKKEELQKRKSKFDEPINSQTH
jgi:hypothetical protein